MPDNRRTPKISADSVAEQFAEKMRALTLDAKEREVAERASALGLRAIVLTGFPISPEALATIPRQQSETLRVICFLNTGTEVRIGAVVPDDPKVRELAYQLGERLHANVATYAISEESYAHAAKRYDALPVIIPITTGVTITEADLARFRAELTDLTLLEAKVRDANVSDVVTLIIAGSLQAKSSDVHLEAEQHAIVIRYRMDGVLRTVATMPQERWKQIVSRVKLLAGLKMNVDDVPQDGRFTITLGTQSSKGGMGLANDAVDVRVSTLPTAFGESVVMRLLMSSATGLRFADLGVRGRAHDQLEREIARPNGMIITTGPTGSGKTTTLYAILHALNNPETKIVTLEDPIEYKLEGINQSQIDPAKEYTFARGLRAVLRQDPDIVMVGEIRDLETAEVAIQAALTGHLMLSTIHTNSASGVIPRFLSMGVKPFLLAPALNAVIGQRLVRRVHDACKEPDALAPELQSRIEALLAALPAGERKALEGKPFQFWKGKGCNECHQSGFAGRIGIYEVFAMSKEIEAEILSEKTSEYRMQELAVTQGMVTMAQDGILKALDGITSVEEVFRVAE